MINISDITAFEYYEDDPAEARRDPDTYLPYSPLEMTAMFARIMGQPVGDTFMKGSPLEKMRKELIKEEFAEVMTADTAEEILKELADLIYVCYGYAATYGWDMNAAVRRVHASNMSKLGDDGKPIYREDGKIMKGPNYELPDLSDLVRT